MSDGQPPAGSPAFEDAAKSAQVRAASLIGKVIAGRYRVHEVIAMGGVATVFLGEHVHMRKRVAIKILHPDAENLPELVARFENESIVGAHIQHPNIASASDFGQLEDGSYYLVLEYVRGSTLHEQIRNGPMPPERAVDIARQIATALDALHQRGILHRDLKPRNVMITDGARPIVKLIDFGFAKVPLDRISTVGGDIDPSKQPITGTGVIFGTVAYMAPEAALGMESVTAKSDLYALGLMLYEMLAGAHPFDATEQGALFLQQRTMVPPPIAQRAKGVQVPSALEGLVMRLLEKSPSARFESATDVIRALDVALPVSVGSAVSTPLAAGPVSSAAGAEAAPPSAAAPEGAGDRVSKSGSSAIPIAGLGSYPRAYVAIAVALGAAVILAIALAVHGSRSGDERSRADERAAASAGIGPAPSAATSAGAGTAVDRSAAGATDSTGGAPRPTAVGGLDGTAWRNKLRVAATSKDWDTGVDSVAALTQIEPSALGERDIADITADVAVGIAYAGGDRANKLFDTLAASSQGIDVLYDLATHRTASKAGKRARDLLKRKDVIDRGSPALRIAMDLRAPGCDDKEALFDRAANEGDERALGLLWTMHSPQCNPKNGDCCFKDSAKIEDAIRTLKARTRAR